MKDAARFVDEDVFTTGTVSIGRFRCTPAHPRFVDSGPIRSHCVVFPRTSVWICHRGGAPFIADPRVATLYNKGQEYTRAAVAADGDRCEWFAISTRVLRDIVASVDPAAAESRERLLRFTYAPCDARLYAAQRALFEHVTGTPSPDPLLVEEEAINAVARIIEAGYRHHRRQDVTRIPKSQRDVTQRVQEILATRVAEKLTLHELSRAVGVSMFHLARVFARVTGVTIHEYRRDLRARRALEWVLESRRDLLDIGLELGYSGHSHFTAEFKRAFGVTPSALRLRPFIESVEDHLPGLTLVRRCLP